MSYETEDAKTVEALEKIKAVLREYDLFASMIVVSEQRVHWLYHTEPSWSALSISPTTGEARFRAKRADFKTAEEHQRVVNLTTGAIISTRDFAAKVFKEMEQLHSMMKDAGMKIEHWYAHPEVKQ